MDRLITWPTYYKENWSHSSTWIRWWPWKEVIRSHRVKSITSCSWVNISLGYINFNSKFDGFFKWFELNEAVEKSTLRGAGGNICCEGSWYKSENIFIYFYSTRGWTQDLTYARHVAQVLWYHLQFFLMTSLKSQILWYHPSLFRKLNVSLKILFLWEEYELRKPTRCVYTHWMDILFVVWFKERMWRNNLYLVVNRSCPKEANISMLIPLMGAHKAECL